MDHPGAAALLLLLLLLAEGGGNLGLPRGQTQAHPADGAGPRWRVQDQAAGDRESFGRLREEGQGGEGASLDHERSSPVKRAWGPGREGERGRRREGARGRTARGLVSHFFFLPDPTPNWSYLGFAAPSSPSAPIAPFCNLLGRLQPLTQILAPSNKHFSLSPLFALHENPFITPPPSRLLICLG